MVEKKHHASQSKKLYKMETWEFIAQDEKTPDGYWGEYDDGKFYTYRCRSGRIERRTFFSSLPDNAKPSEVTEVYWLVAERRSGKYPIPTKNCGKWLIFIDKSDVNEMWAKIKKATEEGKLGNASKVATAKPSPLGEQDTKVICVYTYDWTDDKDVKRIREELKKLGMVNKIPYKSDEDTLSGKYRATGHTRISKYYE